MGPAGVGPRSLGGSTNAVAPLAQFDPVTHEWRRWIAENVLMGAQSGSMIDAMVRAGLDRSHAAREVEMARTHPYLQAAAGRRGTGAAAPTPIQDATTLSARVSKREWVMEFQRRLALLDPMTAAVPVVRRPSRYHFLREYYAANRPVLIEGAMDDWPAMSHWTMENLKQRFGERVIETQAGRNDDPDYEMNAANHKHEVKFGEFIDRVTTCGRSNDFYMTANNSAANRNALSELWNEIVLFPDYLRNVGPEDQGALWLGPAGTVTPLHHDLTNNLMAQVVGRKLVRLIAPQDTAFVYNHRHCYSQVDMTRIDYDRYPLFRNARVIDVTLSPGQVLFLPVGWWHHVTSLDISITVTFTSFVFENDFHSGYTTYGDV
jgi:hypothetical protein